MLGPLVECAAKSSHPVIWPPVSLLTSWLEDDCTNAQLTRSTGTACAPGRGPGSVGTCSPYVVRTEVTELGCHTLARTMTQAYRTHTNFPREKP